MIQRDARHQPERRVGRGGGVPASSHPDFEDRRIEPVPRERQEGGAGDRLEKGRLLVGQELARRGSDRFHQIGELLLGKLTPVHQDAFVDGDEMRGGEAPDAQSVGPENRVQNGDRGTLSVRPRDHHRRETSFRVAELLGEEPDVPGSHLDVELFPIAQERERLLVIHGSERECRRL